MRSAPTALGFSICTEMPVRTPGPMMIGSLCKYLRMQLRKECMTLGTTLAMMTSSTSPLATPASFMKLVIMKPYSSLVRFILVVRR